MKITEITIKIESVIENLTPSGLVEGDAEKTFTEVGGFYHCDGEKRLITYSESGEGGDVYSEISTDGKTVCVKRRGAIESELVFAEGEIHKSLYSVPPYKFDAEVKTRKIRSSLTDAGGSLELFYNMKIGGAEKSARMKIWISTPSS